MNMVYKEKNKLFEELLNDSTDTKIQNKSYNNKEETNKY